MSPASPSPASATCPRPRRRDTRPPARWAPAPPRIRAPGTGTPSHGGFLYYGVLELLQGAARAHDIVGIDLVEVAPGYDPTGSTAILAAQVLLNFPGFIFHARASG